MSATVRTEVRPAIVALVMGLILFMIGAVSVAVVQGVGTAVLSSLNETGSITVPDYLTKAATYVGPIIAILGVGLMIAGAVWIILLLVRIIPSGFEGAE